MKTKRKEHEVKDIRKIVNKYTVRQKETRKFQKKDIKLKAINLKKFQPQL